LVTEPVEFFDMMIMIMRATSEEGDTFYTSSSLQCSQIEKSAPKVFFGCLVATRGLKKRRFSGTCLLPNIQKILLEHFLRDVGVALSQV